MKTRMKGQMKHFKLRRLRISIESPISQILGVPEEKISKRKISIEIIEDIFGTTAQKSPPEKGL